MTRLFAGLALPLLLLFSSCGSDSSGASSSASEAGAKPATSPAAPIPRFNKDSAFAFVAGQLAFGPRVPNTEGHRNTRAWLVRKLEAYGAQVMEQNFQPTAYDGTRLQATNIIGRFNPDAGKRILLAAHWDTRPFADSPLEDEEGRKDEPILGADDGASGVAVLLEVARLFGQNPADIGVDIVFFDAEDYGETGGEDNESWGLGSQHWSRNPHVPGYDAQYGILLDMVGSKGARFTKEGFSMRFAPQVVNKVWKLAQAMGYGNYFVNETTPGILDDHYFVNTIAGIPMIDIVNRPVDSQTGFGHYWHTHDDNLDIIDKNTLRAVGQVVLAVLYREAQGTLN